MFMIVTYPWPVASAHVELTGPLHPNAAMDHRDAVEVAIDQRGWHLEDMVCWTGRERLHFHWYRFRLVASDVGRRSARAIAGSPALGIRQTDDKDKPGAAR